MEYHSDDADKLQAAVEIWHAAKAVGLSPDPHNNRTLKQDEPILAISSRGVLNS